jgi:transcriptional regulator with XRE-family HTH domain
MNVRKPRISENLKFLRQKRNLTIYALSKQTFITHKTLDNYERGVCYPSLLPLIDLAEYFGVTLDELVFENLSEGADG